SNLALNLNIAGSYGGRWDIVNACKKLIAAAGPASIDPETITEQSLGQYMALANQAEPDLLIRTGGDSRISNFLLWQMAYTEFWFTATLWPDIDHSILENAIKEFSMRERRFGLTSAQIEAMP
ncbi:MAG: di-trans,poly-cis-decaprenylcistransferase, partial [Arenimonas sp.]|nr:di-trans,poly-cis-decaprenylcistransferase [Arenimonas sp.]